MINYPYSMPDTKELRQLILDNPDLPVVIMVNEDTWTGEYSTEVLHPDRVWVGIQEMACYNNRWCDDEELYECIVDDVEGETGADELNDEEFDNVVNKIKEKYPLQKVIVVSL